MPPSAPTTSQSKVDRSDPWKEDGNVVLAAEGKHFRVHRSVLSAYSEVFKDMFSCPQAPPNENREACIERCPVIHLQDTATDVQIILKAMYDRSYPTINYDPVPISIVSAFLRLGDKYAIPALVREAKWKLSCSYDPMSVSTAFIITPSDTTKLFPAITNGDPYNFQMMNLLREMDFKAPLPIVMYQCIISCPLQHAIDGYQADGSLYSLSIHNLRSFLLMKDMLENHRVRLAKKLTRSPSCNQTKCEHNLRRLLLEHIECPPLSHWRPQWDGLLCQRCISSLKPKHEAEMDQVWSQIPEVFGFQSWGQMKIQKVEIPLFAL